MKNKLTLLIKLWGFLFLFFTLTTNLNAQDAAKYWIHENFATFPDEGDGYHLNDTATTEIYTLSLDALPI